MNSVTLAPPRSFGLSNLRALPLDEYHQSLLDLATRICGGPTACQHRLKAEARDLVALDQLSGRLQIRWLDLSAGLRAKVEMEVPVPCLPDPSGPLRVATRALLGLVYPPEAVFVPLPRHAFVQILQPRHVWLSNCTADANQLLCLGQLQPGTRVAHILMVVFGALTMQTHVLDVFDPLGVANVEAARWWQVNARLTPLTREPFLKMR